MANNFRGTFSGGLQRRKNGGCSAFSMGPRPGHLILLVVFVLLRQSFASPSSDSHSTPDSKSSHGNGGGDAGAHGGGHGDGHGESDPATTGFVVFVNNFHHVEIPFIIMLWIFVSSLAKVGKKHSFG